MRYRSLTAVCALSIGVLAGCASNSLSPASEQTPAVTQVPCVDDANLVAAVDTFLGAARRDGTVAVHGETGGRGNNLLELLERTDLAATPNPNGEGVLVSLVYGGDGAFARSTAHRAAWLSLDGAIYPVDVDAAQAFSLLWAGYPDDIKSRAGLGQDYFGLDAYGLSDFVAWNADTTADFSAFLVEANSLCFQPTPWG